MTRNEQLTEFDVELSECSLLELVELMRILASKWTAASVDTSRECESL